MRARALVFLMLLSICAPTAFGYSGGSGTSADPYQIATKADLLALAATPADYNDCFILTADIDLVGETFTTAVIAPDTDNVTAEFQGTAFTGVFDGNDHSITNLAINDGGAGNDFLGLFGQVGAGGIVKRLKVENCSVTGSGGSMYVGGLGGWNNGATTQDCSSTGTVSGGSRTGGLIGRHYYSTMIHCWSTASVTGSADYAGGLSGTASPSASISECYAMGNVSGTTYVGGLVGSSTGAISNCYAMGSSMSSSIGHVGGLLGDNYGSVAKCYSTGAVSGSSYTGGLIGYVSGGTTTNSFWDTQTSGKMSSAGGTGKTTSQMQTASTFTGAGWDFVGETANGTNDCWQMLANAYPLLSFQAVSSGTVATPVFSPGEGYYGSEQNVVLICATAGATIHYTTKGIDPTESDPIIASGGSVLVDHDLTLKAKAWKAGMAPSSVGTGIYVVSATAGDIVIGTGTGTWYYPLRTSYHDARTQTIYLASEIGVVCNIGALSLYVDTVPGQVMDSFTIRMKHTDMSTYGSSPNWELSGWTTVYQTNQAISTIGWVQFNFSTQFAFNNVQNLLVDISFNNNSYTSSGLCLYSQPGGYRSVCCAANSTCGDPLTWSAAVAPPTRTPNVPNIRLGLIVPAIATPVFSLSDGTYNNEQNVSVTCVTAGATIHFTVNGLDPMEDDPVIVSGDSIRVDRSMTLKAKAWKADTTPSATAAASYVLKVAAPTFCPDGGVYGSPQTVVISCGTVGAAIHYTVNGSNPTEADDVVNSGDMVSVSVDPETTLKARGFKQDYETSDIKSASYCLSITVYVKPGGSDLNDGLSCDTAKLTIQAGLDIARSGDTVLVASGTYRGTGNRDLDFRGKAIELRSESGPANCIIDSGGYMHRGFYFHSGETTGSTVCGFTITGGYLYGYGAFGGGIYCNKSSPLIRDCIITGNTVRTDNGYLDYAAGGGVYCADSDAIFVGCTISGNRADVVDIPAGFKDGAGAYGGGIYSTGSTVKLRNCRIIGNVAAGGEGEQSDYPDPPWNGGNGCGGGLGGDKYEAANCVIMGNEARAGARGWDMWYFTWSTTDGDACGGAIYVGQTPGSLFTNCTIVANRLTSAGTHPSRYTDGHGVYGNCQMINCILWGHDLDDLSFGASATFSCIEQNAAGQGNVWSNPLFVDNSGSDLRLKADSPCIDAGNNLYIETASDMTGNPRIFDGNGDGTATVDMGAYERQCVTNPACDISYDCDVNFMDYALLAGQWMQSDCVAPYWCMGADFDKNGSVDNMDLLTFAEHWLEVR